MNKRTMIAVVALLALLCLGLYQITRPADGSLGSAPTTSPGSAPDAGVAPDAGLAALRPDVGFLDETAEGRSVRFVRDGQPIAGVAIVAGSAGRYPPEVGVSAADGLYTIEGAAAETFDGTPVEWAELYAQHDGYAVWTILEVDRDEVVDVELTSGFTLGVSVVQSSGAPFAGARVRLSRSGVGLVNVEGITDDQGRTSFAPLASGDYHVSVEAPGRVTATADILIDSADTEVTLEVLPGAIVAGKVVDQDDRPVAGAIVSVFVEQLGTPGSLPRAIVSTDAEGAFRASGLPMGPTYAVATADGAASSRSATIDTVEGIDTLHIVMKPAISVGARVVTESGDPVAGAVVVWRDDGTGASSAAKTDDTGAVRFGAVVPGAILTANLRGWTSNPHRLAEKDSGRVVELALTRGEPPKRVRVDGFPADAQTILATSEGGAACAFETIDARDFWVSGCSDGPATLEVASTSRGTATVRFELRDGAAVKLPETSPLAVLVRVAKPGVVPTAEWSDGASWRVFDLEQTDEQAWLGTADVYPGRYMTRASASSHAPEESTLNIGAAGQKAEVSLEEMVRHEVFVLDERRATVTGARVEVWHGDRRVRVARSAGQLPVVVERPGGDGWSIVAIAPRRGESRQVLDDARLELELTEPLGSVATPGRVAPEEFGKRSDLKVVRDSAAWLFDPVAGAGATGVERGDRYVTARRLGAEIELVVRRGRSDVTIRLPAN